MKRKLNSRFLTLQKKPMLFLRKAHAIFYITKTPASPQKGEEGKEGTIEKIQNQLDSQT